MKITLLLLLMAVSRSHAVDAGPMAKAKDQAPNAATLDALTIDLPYTSRDAQVLASAHLILHDASGQGNQAAWHEPQWARQAKLLKAKLIAIGVPYGNIQVHPVKTAAEVLERIKAVDGAKKLYMLGHAGPLTILVGKEELALKDITAALREAKVDTICNYGCSFLNAGECEIQDLQAGLSSGQELCLYGHQKPSSKSDDSPWDANNPLVRCEVGQDCAKIYQPKMEANARLADKYLKHVRKVPSSRLSPSLMALVERVAAYEGSAPVKVYSGPVLPKVGKAASQAPGP